MPTPGASPPDPVASGQKAPAGAADRLLFRRCQDGDPRAREELVHRFLPLAKRLAGRYRHTDEPQEDLEQVACVGLVKAIDRYDPDRGAFAHYAVPTMMGELKRHLRDKRWGMRVPRSLQERFLKVNASIDELSLRLGRSPTPKDIAENTGLSVEEVLEAFEASSAFSPVRLDAPHHPGEGAEIDRTLGDTVGAKDPHYGFVELGQALAPTLRALPPKHQTILKLRFIDDLSQSEIAEQVGISQMHVSRLLRQSLDRLGAATNPP